MLTKLAIWYLRKRKVSVLIGFITQGGAIQPNNKNSYVYDNTFMNARYFDYNGECLQLPKGKFHIGRIK